MLTSANKMMRQDMKNQMSLRANLLAGGFLALALAFVGCEWTGGSSGGFNTSRAGLETNLSGIYKGTLSGNRAVSQTSGAPITSFNIQHVGNTLQILDSNGQTYIGKNGAPGAVASPSGATISAGAQLAVFQIGWQGTDGVAGREVEFTGVINVVAVEDIRGDTTSTSIANNSSSGTATDSSSQFDNTSNSANNSSTTSSTTSGGDSSGNINITFDGSETNAFGGIPAGNNTTAAPPVQVTVNADGSITVNSNAGNTQDSSNDSSTDSSQSSSSSSATSANATTDSSRDTTRTIDRSFSFTEANSQFRLQGTWIEQGGLVAQVEARSPGAGRLSGSTTEGVSGTPVNDVNTQNQN